MIRLANPSYSVCFNKMHFGSLFVMQFLVFAYLLIVVLPKIKLVSLLYT